MTFLSFVDELAKKYQIKDGATLLSEHKKRFANPLNGEWRGQHIAKKLQAYLGRDLAGLRILDIGAGYGGCSVELIKLGAEVVSIDVESEAKRLAEIYAQDVVSLDYHVIEADSPDLFAVVPPNSIDVILMTSVIEHIADIDGLLGNGRSVLKEGGIFFTVMPNGLNQKIILREPHCGSFGLSILPAQVWPRYAKNVPFVFYRSFQQYESIFMNYGFSKMFILPEDFIESPTEQLVQEAKDRIEHAYSDWFSKGGEVPQSEADIQLLRGCIKTHLRKMEHNAQAWDAALFNLVYGIDTWWAFYKKTA